MAAEVAVQADIMVWWSGWLHVVADANLLLRELCELESTEEKEEEKKRVANKKMPINYTKEPHHQFIYIVY